MIGRALALSSLLLAAGCGSDDSGGGGLPSMEGGGQGNPDGGGGGEAPAGGEGEGEGEAAPDPECRLGQVLRDGQCLDPCNNQGLVCDPQTEFCVRYEGDRSCRAKCGRAGMDCGLGELCLVHRDPDAAEDDIDLIGFCAEGECPEGSHPGLDGWCVCDTGDIPPPDLPCKVEICGPGNHRGICLDPNQICVDGVCR